MPEVQKFQLFAGAAILGTTLMYMGYMMSNQTGSTGAKLAVATNSRCMKLKQTKGETSYEFLDCNVTLQRLIKQLIKTGEINLKNCKVVDKGQKKSAVSGSTDKEQNKIGHCPVWIWYKSKLLTVTEPHLIQSINEGKYVPEIKKPVKSAIRDNGHAQFEKDDSSSASSSDAQKKLKKKQKKAKKEGKKLLEKVLSSSSSSSSSSESYNKRKQTTITVQAEEPKIHPSTVQELQVITPGQVTNPKRSFGIRKLWG